MMQPTNGDISSLTTTISGLLKGNGSSVVVAVAGTDYPGLAFANIMTALNTFTNGFTVAPNSGVGIGNTINNIGTLNYSSVVQSYPSGGTNVSNIMDFMPKGTGAAADGNLTLINLFTTDAVADSTNYGVLRVGSNSITAVCFVASQNSGTGTIYPLVLCAGLLSTNQIYCSPTGPVGINGVPTAGTSLHVKTGAFASNLDSITYAGTISLDVTKGNVHKTNTTNVIGNATINASGGGVAGQEITIIVTNDSSAGRTITFGTNFKSSGTIVGTTSKTATIRFASDGTSWWETSRTLGLS